MEENDRSVVCRACMTEDGEFQSIFVKNENSGIQIHYADMLMAYASVQIHNGDGLSASICLQCAKLATSFYLFKQKCEETDRNLRKKVEIEKAKPIVVYKVDNNNKNPSFEVAEELIVKPEQLPSEADEILGTLDESTNVDYEDCDNVSVEDLKPVTWQAVEILEYAKESVNNLANKLYNCDLCSKSFTEESYYIYHRKFHDMNDPKCNNLNVQEEVINMIPEDLVDSIESKEVSEVIEISEVGVIEDKVVKTMETEDFFKDKIKTDRKNLQCGQCHKKFTKSSHLVRHLKIHAKVKPHMCNLCNKGFARMEQLNNHMNMHSGVKPHVCTICSKGFNQISNLKDHMRIHNGEKPFLCSTCGKGFNQLGNLRQHTVRHSGIKAHLCSICGNGFASKGELLAHSRKHSGARPFVCQVCNNGFTTSSSLTKHKRIHTGEKPYECDVCNMKFSRSGILARHKRTHTGEKPYVCRYCSRAFSQSNDLTSHLRIHTNEKPFTCDICGQAFRQSSALKTHKKTHRPVVESKMLIALPGAAISNFFK